MPSPTPPCLPSCPPIPPPLSSLSQYGISKWPARRLVSISRRVAILRTELAGAASGAAGANLRAEVARLERYREQIYAGQVRAVCVCRACVRAVCVCARECVWLERYQEQIYADQMRVCVCAVFVRAVSFVQSDVLCLRAAYAHAHTHKHTHTHMCVCARRMHTHTRTQAHTRVCVCARRMHTRTSTSTHIHTCVSVRGVYVHWRPLLTHTHTRPQAVHPSGGPSAALLSRSAFRALFLSYPICPPLTPSVLSTLSAPLVRS
jgi:hypothetical protein